MRAIPVAARTARVLASVANNVVFGMGGQVWWERDVREPLERFWPALVAYLGRAPWPLPTNLGEQLHAERRRRGLAISEAAAAAGVDETTFWWWESCRRSPRYPRTKALAARFLSQERS
jgi:hypothetical protein